MCDHTHTPARTQTRSRKLRPPLYAMRHRSGFLRCRFVLVTHNRASQSRSRDVRSDLLRCLAHRRHAHNATESHPAPRPYGRTRACTRFTPPTPVVYAKPTMTVSVSPFGWVLLDPTSGGRQQPAQPTSQSAVGFFWVPTRARLAVAAPAYRMRSVRARPESRAPPQRPKLLHVKITA